MEQPELKQNSETELTENECDKNKHPITCQRCSSLILKPEAATKAKKEIFLPYMHKKTETQNPEDGETLRDFWMVDDMFAFENVGFSNTVGNSKFLICADCEIGPVGYHDITNKKEYFIAIERIKES